MFRARATVLALVALVVATVAAAPAAPPVASDGCVRAPVDAAVSTLVADDAHVAGTAEVAGLPVVTAVDPFIPPGIPSALLRVGEAWCSAEHFNAAAAEHLADASPRGVATAFASVAGMQYLGDVTVGDVIVDGSEVTLTTTGGRHDAVSDWTVVIAAGEVVSATFTTTGWAARADGASAGTIEGITSLPGHTRTFTRTLDGRVVIDATVADLVDRAAAERAAAVDHAAEVAGVGPGDDLKHTFEDGFTIKVSYGMSPYTPDTGTDTGVKHADRLRTMLAGVVSRYEDFLSWGVSDPFGNTGRTVAGADTGLPEQAGYINVDSPLAPACLACAFLTDAMEVHIAFLFPEIAPQVVPIDYPDSEEFLITVLGHEMVHGLQGGYSDGDAGVFTSAFIEGSARASESIHANAEHSHHTGAIHYVDSGNGCEGFENGRGGWIEAQAAGPFNGHTYDACYFWWTYYAAHGPEGLVALLEALPEAIETSSGDAAARNQRLLDVASPTGDGVLDLARWGAAAAAGSDADGYTIPAGDSGESFDWFELLRPAQRATALEQTQSVSVADAGVRAYVAGSAATLTEVPAGASTYVFSIDDRQLVPTPAAAGTEVAAGDIVVVAVAGGQSASGTLSTA